MTKLSEISQPNWTMSLSKQGEVVQGIDEISQNIMVIVKTQKGTDPLRPDFGTDLLGSIDRPLNERVPQLIKDIVDAVNTWETRAEVKNVSYKITGDGGLELIISWVDRVSGIPGKTKVTINGTN
jgi:phage baseplate assembly protein W